jgi:hypothetical protein
MKITNAELEIFRERLIINENDLNTEVSQQAELFFQVAQISAIKSNYKESAKYDLERSYSEVSLSIRQECLKDKAIKMTEALIDQLVKSDEKYILAQKYYLDTKKEADEWSALKEGFQSKGFLLKELCNLFIAGYYTSTNIKTAENKVSDLEYEKNKSKLRTRRKAE